MAEMGKKLQTDKIQHIYKEIIFFKLLNNTTMTHQCSTLNVKETEIQETEIGEFWLMCFNTFLHSQTVK